MANLATIETVNTLTSLGWVLVKFPEPIDPMEFIVDAAPVLMNANQELVVVIGGRPHKLQIGEIISVDTLCEVERKPTIPNAEDVLVDLLRSHVTLAKSLGVCE